jgi:hypothetical protein
MTPTTLREAKPVAGKSRLPSGGKKRERGPAAKLAFFVLANLAASPEEQPYGVDEPWQVAFSAVAPQLIELLIEDRQILSLSRPHAGKCLVLAVETEGFPPHTAIVSVKALKAKLKPLLAAALKGGAPTHPCGPLLGGEDLPNGQLLGTMLLLEDVKAAKALCAQIKSGDVGLLKKRKDEPPPGETQPQRVARIKELINNGPVLDYDACFASVMELNQLTKAEIAARLAPALNAKLRSIPHERYEDKQTAVSWVNAQLRKLGLAVRCPVTGRPATLVTDIRGGGYDISRFRFQIREDNGHRRRTCSSRTVPELVLMPDEERQEPIIKWAERLRKQQRGRERH